MNFKEAYKKVHNDDAIYRKGWNKAKKFIIWFNDEEDCCYLAIKQDGRYYPWAPQTADLLATDWECKEHTYEINDVQEDNFTLFINDLLLGKIISCDVWEKDSLWLFCDETVYLQDSLFLVTSDGKTIDYSLSNYELIYGKWKIYEWK